MNPRQVAQASFVAVRNLIMGGNLASLALLSNPRKMALLASENLFLFNAINSCRGVIEKNVYSVLPSGNIESVNLGGLQQQTWFFNISSFAVDIISLCLICKLIQPKVVFEIGTLNGYTAFNFALNTGDDAHIYTLDLPPSQRSVSLKTTIMDQHHISKHVKMMEHYAFEGEDVSSKITCLFGDSASFDYLPYKGLVDFFFIDGAHSYEYVRSDTLNALKCCHPGSVIAWHDFGRFGVNGVAKWILEFAKANTVYAVPGGSLAFMVIE